MLQALAQASVASLKAVHGIGPKRAQAIYEALAQPSDTGDTVPKPLQPTSAQVKFAVQ
ncbi:MAG: hypothetical protein HC767_08860 [Akkermansiaceae bacterium]|nr:hypothetical protein [Akkermansiaceae bacterium]